MICAGVAVPGGLTPLPPPATLKAVLALRKGAYREPLSGGSGRLALQYFPQFMLRTARYLPPPAVAYRPSLWSYPDGYMVHTVADITPGGAKAALKPTRTPANWIIISSLTGNAADIRVGDVNVSATSGVVVKAGTSLLLPPIGDTAYLDLAGVYVFGTTTDKVQVLYGTH